MVKPHVLSQAAAVLLALQLSLGLAGVGAAQASTDLRQAFLVQNSGWMEPFFNDPESPFIPLLGALGEQLAVDGQLAVASFNQQGHIPERQSPHVVYEGAFTSTAFRDALGQIDLPRRPDGHFADADFHGAFVNAVSDMLDGQSGVVWMVTNNKNAPGNDPQVEENTRAFFQQLAQSSAITRLVAYPIRMPVEGEHFSEEGLIIYGIGYGRTGGQLLEGLVERVDASGLFADPAVTLKPLDDIPLRFEPRRIHPPELEAQWADGALIIEGLDAQTPQEIFVEGRLHSEFYPHVLDEAALQVAWTGHPQAEVDTGAVQAAISPARVSALQHEGAGDEVTIRFRTPAFERPDGIAGLQTDSIHLVGAIDIVLGDLTLRFSEDFKDKMESLYGLDQLPVVFFDNEQVSASSATLPVRISVHYSVVPLVLSLAGLAIVVIGGGGLWFWTHHPRTVTVPISGQMRRVSLRPLQTKVVKDPDTGVDWRVKMGITGKPGVQEIGRPD